jgi:hypothetical protein
MSCDISRGKNLLSCKNAVSGLKAIYMANFDDYFTDDDFVSNASGHTMVDLGTLTEVYKFELKNSANTFQQDITSSRDNGTTFFNQVLNFTLTKLSAEMEFQVKMMAWGRPIIFVETNGGIFFAMGVEHGCEIAGNSQVQGTMDSLNGYVLTATGMEPAPIYYLNDDTVTALLALVSSDNITE